MDRHRRLTGYRRRKLNVLKRVLLIRDALNFPLTFLSVYKTDVEEQTSDPLVPPVIEAAPLALLPDENNQLGGDDLLGHPTALNWFTTRGDEVSVNIDQQGASTFPLIKEMASPNKLEHSQVSGEVTLNIPQAKARRPSRGRKCRKAGTPDSCNPRAAVVKRVMRRKQLLGSDKVSITDLSKPAEDHYEGQSMGATALPDERSPMIPPTPLVNARVSDIDSSALGLVEDKGRSYPTSLSTNANDRTTNESEIHDFEVSRVSHLGAEQSEETKQLIAHPDNNEADVNAKIDGPRRSQTPVEDIRVMTKLGKRRTRQTGRDAGNTITRNLEEGNGPRKSRKTTNDDIQAGESANGCHSKVTLSGCATNEIKLEITAPPDAFDEIADQSKENRFCKHKITKTKSTSVTMKKGSHTTFTQGKPKPKPRLVISAKHRDPVPTEETTRVVPANDPPPITNEPVTTTYVHNPIPTPIAQTVR